MRLALFILGLVTSPFSFADDDFGIQNCSDINLDFKNVRQVRDFDNGEVRMYVIDRVTTNGIAVTYGKFCRFINGSFDTDLKDAHQTIDIALNVDRVRLKLFLPEGEGARLAWMTVQIKKDAPSERSAISAWLH